MQLKKYFAEFLGTFILVFAATGASVVNQESNQMITHLGCAATCGLVVLALIYALGDVSGAHVNPAVTLAFAVNKQMPWKNVAPYILAQTTGAIAASFSLSFMFPSNETLGATLPSAGVMQSFAMETILSFILMFVILNVATGAKEKGITAGIAIGAVVGFEVLFAGPVSGGSMNPSRSIAPALVSGHLEHSWIYLTAPFAGMLLAVPVYRLVKQ